MGLQDPAIGRGGGISTRSPVQGGHSPAWLTTDGRRRGPRPPFPSASSRTPGAGSRRVSSTNSMVPGWRWGIMQIWRTFSSTHVVMVGSGSESRSQVASLEFARSPVGKDLVLFCTSGEDFWFSVFQSTRGMEAYHPWPRVATGCDSHGGGAPRATRRSSRYWTRTCGPSLLPTSPRPGQPIRAGAAPRGTEGRPSRTGMPRCLRRSRGM